VHADPVEPLCLVTPAGSIQALNGGEVLHQRADGRTRSATVAIRELDGGVIGS